MLQDRLEEFFDVNVGSASRIDSAFIVEENFDSLIIGDVISDTIPSVEIQYWIQKYKEITRKNNLAIKALSGFYVAHPDINTEPFWIEFLQDNINAEVYFPPILSLKLNKVDLALEIGALELIKAYSNQFLELFF